MGLRIPKDSPLHQLQGTGVNLAALGLVQVAPQEEAPQPDTKGKKVYPVVQPSSGKLILVMDLPGLEVLSEANETGHWAKRYKRFEEQKRQVAVILTALYPTLPQTLRHLAKLPNVRLRGTFTRRGAKDFDTDNLAGSFKGVQDAVAEWVGIDDGNKIWDWNYAQETPCPIGLRIEISADRG